MVTLAHFRSAAQLREREMHSHEVSRLSNEAEKASHDAAKWKQEAIRLYKVRAEELNTEADTNNIIADSLPNACRAALFVSLWVNQLRHGALVFRTVATQATAKLNQGDLKEPLDETVWQEKK